MRRDIDTEQPHSTSWFSAAVGYGSMVLVTIVVSLIIRSYGETLLAPAVLDPSPAAASAQGGNIFLRLLVALTAIIVTGQILAKVFSYINQPPVIGEVIAGI